MGQKNQNWNKILELIFEYPNQKFSVREISKKTKIPSSSVQRYMQDFKKQELIDKNNQLIINHYSKFLKTFFIIKKMLNIGLIDYIEKTLVPETIILFGGARKGEYDHESDIDLFIITRKNLLWTTRIFSYFTLKVFGFDLRKSGKNNQKDKLCLNMWMDETDLAWRKSDRNLYTAHEIAQVAPLVNKNNTYEKFIYKNKWILKYWPNAVKIGKYKEKNGKHVFKNPSFSLVEKIAFNMQYGFMKSKITREMVTPTRAIFHPQDLGKLVISRLAS